MTRTREDRTRAVDEQPDQRRWWRRIQWIDIVLIIAGVMILLMLTAELWLPHQAGGR